MQYQPTRCRPQLSSFEGFIAQSMAPFNKPASAEQDTLSELGLRGSLQHCHALLAPVLRELSEATDSRWLTLVASPATMPLAWLRDVGLNRNRILLLQPDGTHSALQLACKALGSGCSHTVVSWLGQLDSKARIKLRAAASHGNAQSLNIRLG